ncbi:hypothetical protein O1611_g7526 [Lasiodiplodia mahajangana]|uniref:Uncharacterized protein n=1 Tax=Lasiodiplodia mahajangana TaxID=1108764 RepID=A0ACC2JEZ9_9PEZI|nr:hypothetical protein O1611_g7526 [Lasiodiplodia mahajangana]
MTAFNSVYHRYYDNGLKYEFLTEISPDVWKISRKSDRMEYLAQDVTDRLFIDVNSKPQKLTDYGRLLAPDGYNLIENVKTVLNHPNLVSLVDCFALQVTKSGKRAREKWYAVWDYCDAGNLGNLLLPAQPRPQDQRTEDGDTIMKDAGSEPENQAGPKFLSESFCWHVLTSLLRALAWLHDGVQDVVQGEDGGWVKLGEDTNWSTMLHRNITPRNIFIGYPRRKEWYGPVKLGNYGRLFISGHCEYAGATQVPATSKVIAPPPDQKFASLEDLIAFDTNNGSIYPRQPNQPYTLVSEYRAVGEIMQAMMVEPTGNKHVRRIQSQSVKVNLRDANYSGRLKNFVVKLMEFDPWQNVGESDEPRHKYVTSNLYREGQEGLQWFLRAGKKEADAFVTSRMAENDDYVENTALKATQLFDSYQNVQEILEQLS